MNRKNYNFEKKIPLIIVRSKHRLLLLAHVLALFAAIVEQYDIYTLRLDEPARMKLNLDKCSQAIFILTYARGI